MSNLRRVSPAEAKQLLEEGYTYVDVRTVEEFHLRHPRGAVNVPLAILGPTGPEPNADFLPIMQRLFGEDAKIVVGCATGVRSRRAAEMLGDAGFREVVDQRAGTDGARSPFGALHEPGWIAAGYPTDAGPDEGSYERVQARTAR
jgi:rhodanese-related sulfurtransferase